MGKRAYLKQAAADLELTEYQLRRMAKERKIPFLMSGNRYIFDIDQCQEFLKSEAMQNVKVDKNSGLSEYGVLRRVMVD